jgi:hypothetical protein
MTIDLTALAQQLGPYLAPALPYLLKGVRTLGEEAAKTVGRKIGEGDWLKSIKLWEKMEPQVQQQPEVAKRLGEIASKPDDPRAEVLLSWELEKVLAVLSLEVLNELNDILQESPATFTQNMVANGDGNIVGNRNVSQNITAKDNSTIQNVTQIGGSAGEE